MMMNVTLPSGLLKEEDILKEADRILNHFPKQKDLFSIDIYPDLRSGIRNSLLEGYDITLSSYMRTTEEVGYILLHEMGHAFLGHCGQMNYYANPYVFAQDIRRNEIDADYFSKTAMDLLGIDRKSAALYHANKREFDEGYGQRLFPETHPKHEHRAKFFAGELSVRKMYEEYNINFDSPKYEQVKEILNEFFVVVDPIEVAKEAANNFAENLKEMAQILLLKGLSK